MNIWNPLIKSLLGSNTVDSFKLAALLLDEPRYAVDWLYCRQTQFDTLKLPKVEESLYSEAGFWTIAQFEALSSKLDLHSVKCSRNANFSILCNLYEKVFNERIDHMV